MARTYQVNIQRHYSVLTLTTTLYTSIFKVVTVVLSHAIVRALNQSVLTASTANVVQQNGTSALAEECKRVRSTYI